MDDPNVEQRAKDIATDILTVPPEHAVSTINDLLGERIRLYSRDEHGEPDQRIVAMWVNELSMRVTIWRLATDRMLQTRFGQRDFNIARATSARSSLVAIVAYLLADR